MLDRQARERRQADSSPVEIESFIQAVSRQGVPVSVDIDRPDDPAGEWWLDIRAADGFSAPVAWRPRLGFGLFTSAASYGSRPDEVYKEPGIAGLRLHSMYAKWLTFRQLTPLWLPELRELIGETQATMALALKRNQPAISKLEGRSDVKISTLQKFIESLGGRLEIRAHFETMDVALVPPRPSSQLIQSD